MTDSEKKIKQEMRREGKEGEDRARTRARARSPFFLLFQHITI